MENEESLEEWLEGSIRSILESRPSSMAIVALFEDGECETGYYNSTAQDMAEFASNIHADSVMQIIRENAEEIMRLLEGEE